MLMSLPLMCFRIYQSLAFSFIWQVSFNVFLGNSSTLFWVWIRLVHAFQLSNQLYSYTVSVLAVAYAASPQTLYHLQLYCDGKIPLCFVAISSQWKWSSMLLLLTRTRYTRPTKTPSWTEGLVYRQKSGFAVVDRWWWSLHMWGRIEGEANLQV